ncbi:MAG: hypothetical protein RJA34_640 [Pseudomonadota bacterium]|jgi:hypothetical protein
MSAGINLNENSCMKIELRQYLRAIFETFVFAWRLMVFYTRWVVCIGAALLVWGGALWFGSLAWDQKQGGVLAFMGFIGWLAVCRFVLPGFWILSIEVVRRFFRYIEYRFL